MDRVQPCTLSSVQDEESKPKFPLFQLGKKKESDCLLRVFPNKFSSQPFLGEEIEGREVWQNGKVRVEVCNLLLQKEGLRCSAEVWDGDRNRHRNLGSLRNIRGAVIQAQEGFLSFGCRQMKFHRKKKPRGSHGNDLV